MIWWGVALVWIGLIGYAVEWTRWGGRAGITKIEIGTLLIAASGVPVILIGVILEVR